MESKSNMPVEETKMGRRKLLKAIAATSGAVVAASMLPQKWAEPVIEAGVLPAHAQGSPTSDNEFEAVQTEDGYEMFVEKNGSRQSGTFGPNDRYEDDDAESGDDYQIFVKSTSASGNDRPRVRVYFNGSEFTGFNNPNSFNNDGNEYTFDDWRFSVTSSNSLK